jgi:DNA excision repair protein ERCC-4
MSPVRVIVDTREQRPWTFEDLPQIETRRAKLEAGDYSLEGLENRVAIERKSLDDWIGTVLRERQRFYRELERLRAFDYRSVVIESSVAEIMRGRYKSEVHPNVVLGFIAEVSVGQAVPVLLGGTRAESQVLAGRLLEQAAKRFASAIA